MPLLEILSVKKPRNDVGRIICTAQEICHAHMYIDMKPSHTKVSTLFYRRLSCTQFVRIEL